MRTIYVIVLGLSVLAGSGTARAQQPNLRETLQNLDANGDTVIDRDEVPEAGRAAFDRLLARGDANKNGTLEADEVRALVQKLRVLGGAAGAPGQRFKAMDKDGDGKVSKDEFTGPAPLFGRLDADKDGVITRQEIARFAAANAPTPARLKAMDKDGDGKVSRAEFTGPAPQFLRLDTDQDGVLSGDELRGPRGAARKNARRAKEKS